MSAGTRAAAEHMGSRGAPSLTSGPHSAQSLDEETPTFAPAHSDTRFGRVVGASIVGTTVEW